MVVRRLTESSAADATMIWAAGMDSYDTTLKPGEHSDFVNLKMSDPTDMGDVFANYVQGSSRNFWTAHIGDAMVGCVGAIVRPPDDLARTIPKDKEYLVKSDDSDGSPAITETMWGPLGVPDDKAPGAVELVRMSVSPDWQRRGIAKKLAAAVTDFAITIGADYVVLTTVRQSARPWPVPPRQQYTDTCENVVHRLRPCDSPG